MSCDLNHTTTEVKGGWIISFNNPPEGFLELIRSIAVPICGEDGIKMVKSFTASGDIVFEERYVPDILNAIYGVIRDFNFERIRESLGT